ncbi:MAG: hypothetical protein IPM61_08495 [Chlorobi bacterium]|nr:MAG: hypothetical protein UZ07_CHB004001362 [Chlorobi bacterium OLB7]MBK8911359.1 hypothetical protein [Chlorobiota bacterium]MBX7217599.1 hypothetical protein [Candidatus Kapabacteria bacterium]
MQRLRLHIPILILLVAAARSVAQDVEKIAEEPPFSLSGSVGASLVGYSASGIPERREPFSWTLNGTLTPTIYSLQLPIDFIFSEQERDFRQPFNQFGISPRYKSLTGFFGYRSMTMSPYTLDGVTFLGAGVEFNPGKFRFAGMIGRLQRAVEEDTTQFYNIPAYQRDGYALKVGFGSEESYFDVIWFHAGDDSASLKKPPTQSGLSPAENSVVGLTLKTAITPELTLDADVAASLHTRDLRAPLTDLDSSGLDFFSSIQDIHNSTALNIASKAGISFAIPTFKIRAGYERVEPNFTSLGTWYLASDFERWTIAPSLDLFNNRLRLGGSLGIQHDNLLETRFAETNRLIGSANVGWSPTDAFGVDANYINYSTDQSAGRVAVNDSIRVRNVSHSATLAPRLLLQSETLNHFITVIGNYQEFSDLNSFTNAFTDSRGSNLSLIYNLTFIESAISLGFSVLRGNTETGTLQVGTTGGTLNGSIGLLENKLTIGASGGYTQTQTTARNIATGQSESFDGTVINLTANAGFRPTTEDQFTFTLYRTQGAGTISASSDFSELTATLGYSRTFAWKPTAAAAEEGK